MKNLFRNLFAVCILATLSLFITTPKGEAADYYSTIYNQVSSANGNPTEDDWITNAILYASSSYQVDPFLITSRIRHQRRILPRRSHRAHATHAGYREKRRR